MVEQYLQAVYNTKKWPFISLIQVFNELKGLQTKEETRAELNELVQAGKIRKREGINGDLIEIIDNTLIEKS